MGWKIFIHSQILYNFIHIYIYISLKFEYYFQKGCLISKNPNNEVISRWFESMQFKKARKKGRATCLLFVVLAGETRFWKPISSWEFPAGSVPDSGFRFLVICSGWKSLPSCWLHHFFLIFLFGGGWRKSKSNNVLVFEYAEIKNDNFFKWKK